ncbi:MAG: outer membrane lipoprotein-sorting protein [Spirochaetaceae bacterium]|jgi:outer membrane lipoprotein-sorting protein|nr:outer membrane lipoprotein-sorting protein [Spirochaetaceae bacterium]
MKVKVFVVLFVLVAVTFTYGQAPSAAELLRRVDENEIYTTIEYEGEMIIEYQNRRYVKTLKAWARENTDNFTEFTNPEDRGTKYLKRGGRLYVYSPDTEEVMLISGHMLKESMMGSDLSYEDTLENEKLSARYNPVLTGSDIWNNNGVSRDCWVLDLTAKRKTESYPKQKLWIDKETEDCLHYELFALSGAKLKEYNLKKIETIGGRRFPVETEIRDFLRRGSKTTLILKNIILDQPIPNSVFSTRNLER